MTSQEMIQALRKEAQSNKVFNTVCHVFAFRKRARNSLTVSGLAQRMKAEGFTFDNQEYIKIIKFLSSLGLGKVSMVGGRITGLSDVRITLQSIGEVAVGTQQGFKSFKQRNRYQELAANKQVVEKVWKAPEPSMVSKVTLAVDVNGKLIKLEIPSGFTPDELASIIKGLQGFPKLLPHAA